MTSPAPLMPATSEFAPGVVVITAAGEIDMTTRPVLEREFAEALSRRPERLVLDFVGIGFCGVTGVALLAQLRDDCADAGVELELKPSRTLRRALDTAGVAPLFRLTGPWAGRETAELAAAR